MKLIFLLFGLAVGFGGGVWWGVHHPTQAAQISDQEERKFLEYQVKITETIKQKLDQLASRQQQQPAKGPGSGFVSSGPAPSGPDPEIASLRIQQDQQLDQLKQRLQQLAH